MAVDDLLFVDAYPVVDSKTEVLQAERHAGGLTGTALVAAVRLGARCAYAGTLGNDEFSEFVIRELARENVDVAHVKRQNDARPIKSTIIVDKARGTRNIFLDLKGVVGCSPQWPDASLITATKVLFVDNFGMDGMIRAARLAREAGIPVVADLESNKVSRFDELVPLVGHLILSQRFAQTITGLADPPLAVKRLWRTEVSAAVVTCGAEGSWWTDGADIHHTPAYKVATVDSTGCGDVFHGAYAAGLAEGMALPELIRFASAAAALKATKPGGQVGIPTRQQLRQFVQEH